MTSTVSIAPDHALVRLTGDVSGADLLDACLDLRATDGWRPGLDEVWDLRGARVGIEHQALDRLVDGVVKESRTKAPCQVAVVTLSDGVAAVAVLLDHRLSAHGRHYATFSTLGDARHALGLPG